MIAANLGGFPQKGKLMLVGGLWMGGLFIAFTQMSMFIPALFMLALGNVGGMIFQTTNNTVIQSNIPAEVRGRVMSVMMMSFGLMPLGVLPVAAAADRFGPDVAVAGSSTLLLVALVAFFTLSRRLRTLRLDQLREVDLSPAQAAKGRGRGAHYASGGGRALGQERRSGVRISACGRASERRRETGVSTSARPGREGSKTGASARNRVSA